MNPGVLKRALVAIIAIALLAGACSAGFVAGRVYQPSENDTFFILPSLGKDAVVQQPEGGTPKDLERLFAPFWQAWELVHKQYVDQPVDDVALMRGAIKGMLEALGDENSSYIDPEQLKLFTDQLTGEEYEGIGAWVDTNRDYLTIISPMIGSPAEKAGLKPGDEVIAIDGEDMTGVDGELARQKVLGPAGSKVTLTIRRAGVEAPFDVVVTRGSIISSNVIGRMLEDDVAYVQLITFGDDKTTDDLRRMLDRLLEQEPAGLILDLRYNGGGLLESAIEVASEFIGEGVVAYEVYGDGRKET
ncbi:MAG: S41 family peptidase, partial [Anaerolineales bacterium]|nr:S41 family peptidase [Anaerolineales bacterium]